METGSGVRPSRRKRRLVLGVGLVIIGLLVAALVGLQLAGSGKTSQPRAGGLNAALPAAHFRAEKPLDKLGLYEKAERDSSRMAERAKGDAFARLSMKAAADSSAGSLLSQLDNLKRLVHPVGAAVRSPEREVFRAAPAENGGAREELEGLLQRLHRPVDTGGGDPQLERLSGMLDKIIRIQHPPMLVADSSKPVMQLEQAKAENAVNTLAADGGSGGGFYGIDGEDGLDTAVVGNAFSAVIPETQVLVAGATVALRLLEEARIGSVVVPRGELLYGKAALSGDRLIVGINSVRVGHSVYPVALQVYDLDGLAGIHVPGAITRDVLKQSAAEGVNGIGVVTSESSLGASAAEAGIEAARSLMSRKISLIRVSVPAGYRVLIKNNH